MTRSAGLVRLLLATGFFLALCEGGFRWTLDRALVPADASSAAYFAALGPHANDRPVPPRPAPAPAGFRIVVVGDSTPHGFPYSVALGGADAAAPGELSFGRFLADGLQAATGTAVDLQGITVGGRTSVGVLADLDAALALRPDLLIVYVGHNEPARRLHAIGPFGRARHGGLDRVAPGWHDALRGLGLAVRTWRAKRFEEMPATLPIPHDLRLFAWLLAQGDPEARTPDNLPLEPREIALHLDRYEANLRALVARTGAAGVRLVLVEPASSLLAAPVASGRRYDDRAQRAWEAGVAALTRDAGAARALLVRARDLDPVPMRLTGDGLERLRRAAGDTPLISLADVEIQDGFLDLMHPTAELAAVFAERVAARLPFADVPRLAPGDGAALARFRDAARARLERPDLRRVIETGDAVGRAAGAYIHLMHGNRAAAEADVRRVPEERRDLRLTLLLDLALRWRGAHDEANTLLTRASTRHPDWTPALAWWRQRAAQ